MYAPALYEVLTVKWIINYLIQQHSIFLDTTKQRIANNLNDIDEIMEVELKNSKNDGMGDT
jgi:hypothetical protein